MGVCGEGGDDDEAVLGGVIGINPALMPMLLIRRRRHRYRGRTGGSLIAMTVMHIPHRSVVISLMRLVCTICWATFWSGPRTAGTATTTVRQVMGVHGLAAIVGCAFFAGGAWFFTPQYARSAFRFRFVMTDRSGVNGFRLARMLP